MQVKINQAAQMVKTYLRAGLVPYVHGSPGCGKSMMLHQVAQEFNLEVIDLRLSQCDPTDLSGFPTFENGRARYAPMDTFPIQGDKLPDGKEGWLLLLDELSSAPPAIQAASYKLILDRMVGQFKLHDRVAIVAAGNLDTDNAVVESMSTALQSRMVHIEMVVDSEEWIDWATKNDVDFRITSYIRFKPQSLYTFKPDHSDKTYACPRTWSFANKILNQKPEDKLLVPLLTGTLSEGVAREFVGFTKIFQDLPTIDQIKAKPESTPVPKEPSTLFALSGSLGNHMDKTNASTLIKYINRMPSEFQIITLQDAIRRKKDLFSHPEIIEWSRQNASFIFGD